MVYVKEVRVKRTNEVGYIVDTLENGDYIIQYLDEFNTKQTLSPREVEIIKEVVVINSAGGKITFIK